MTRLSNPQEDTEDSDEERKGMSLEQKEAFCDLVNNTHKVISYDMEVMNIIEEEASVYFSGKRDVNKTIQIIQSRCTTYMNENR